MNIDRTARGLAKKALTRQFTSATTAAAASPPASATTFRTEGYAAAGDGGGALYVLNTDGVTRNGDIVTANSRRYMIAETEIDPRMLGAKADLIWLTNAVTTASSTAATFSATTNWAGFTSADVGKVIGIRNAGAAVNAYGWVSITKLPSNNDTLVIGGVTLTFKTSGAAGVNQMNISATKALMATDLAAFLTTNVATYAVTATALNTEVKLTSSVSGTGGNGVTLVSTPGTATSSPRVECLQNALAGGLAAGWHVTTIAAVTGVRAVTLTVAAVATTSGATFAYGTDNLTAINNALTLATDGMVSNTVTDLLINGRFPNLGGQGDAYDGARTVVFRGLGRAGSQSRYGVSGEVSLLSGAIVDFQGITSLAALPNFSGQCLLGMPADGSSYYNRINNMSLEGLTFADKGFWARAGSSPTITGRSRAYSVRRYPFEFGYADGANSLKTAKVDYLWADWYPFTTSTLNDPAGASVVIQDGATDCQFGKHMAFGYRVGWRDMGGASITCDDSHVWTGSVDGSMLVGYDLRGGSCSFGMAYADSPSADTADATSNGLTTYGFIFRGYTTIRRAKVFLNSGAASIVDNQCIGLQSYYQGTSGRIVIPEVQLTSDNVSVQYQKDISTSNLLAAQNFEVRNIGAPSTAIKAHGAQTRDLVTQGFLYQTGRYITPEGVLTVAAGAAVGTDTIHMFMGRLRQAVTLDRLVCRVSTLFSGGFFQIGIYATDPATGLPTGSPLVSTSSLSTTSATTVSATVAVTLPAGWYWFGVNCDNATAAFTSISNASLQQEILFGVASTSQLGSSSLTAGLSYAQAFNAWPDLTTKVIGDYTETTALTVPMVWPRSL